MKSQQLSVTVGTDWQMILGEQQKSMLILQNKSPLNSLLFYFGSNPKDNDGIVIGQSSTLILDAAPSDQLWLKGSAANTAAALLIGVL